MRLALLGVGLIGGSIGLAARGRAEAHVVGYDTDSSALADALRLGAIDEGAGDVSEAVARADVVFVAAPVGALADMVRAALAVAGPNCAVSDVGSTKQAIVQAIADERFVGGHPLAGAETAGVQQARADLFEDAAWYLTPGGSAPWAVERMSALISALGAHPATIEAGVHDRLMARLSHLPHVLANVLVAGAARALEREREALGGELPAWAPSFRDATRVAGANTRMWVDIYLSNRDALIPTIDEAVGQLGAVRAALEDADAVALAAWNDRARSEREQVLDAAYRPRAANWDAAGQGAAGREAANQDAAPGQDT
jgi:prephenate dehydrogenase